MKFCHLCCKNRQILVKWEYGKGIYLNESWITFDMIPFLLHYITTCSITYFSVIVYMF